MIYMVSHKARGIMIEKMICSAAHVMDGTLE